MRSYDLESLADEGLTDAAPWQLDLLKLNPDYTCWGPYEDYMCKKGDGWDSRVVCPTWADMTFKLDDLNEVVNFYFEVTRPGRQCLTCSGTGEHPDARTYISDAFYQHSSPFCSTPHNVFAKHIEGFGQRAPAELLAKYGPEFAAYCEEMRVYGYWDDRITEDEADALIANHRTPHFEWGTSSDPNKNPAAPRITAADFNAENSRAGRPKGGIGHDALNRWILCKARAERLGVPTDCPASTKFGGDCNLGTVYTRPAQVGLVMWVLHPRKGCSRGVHVERIEREEVPAALSFLQQAAQRNAERFAGVVRRLAWKGTYDNGGPWPCGEILPPLPNPQDTKE